MAKKVLDSISNRFHYHLIMEYENFTYPMDIIFVNESCIFVKTYRKFVKLWPDRISGVIYNAKAKLIQPVKGKIRGLRPLKKKGEDLDFDSNEWLLEVEIENKEEIPAEWIGFSLAEEAYHISILPPLEES